MGTERRKILARAESAKKTRLKVGHTQRAAAALLGVSLRTWEEWEAARNPMPASMLALYRHLAGIEPIPFAKFKGGA